jgi:hypothetical protein
MKECLQCKKQYEGQRPTSKFCSTKCRVAYSRKNGNKKSVSATQVQVLYNATLDLLEKIEQKVFQPINKDLLPNNFTHSFSGIVEEKKPLEIKRTVEQWITLKRECQTMEEWAEIKNQILTATNLSDKQKQFIINN